MNRTFRVYRLAPGQHTPPHVVQIGGESAVEVLEKLARVLGVQLEGPVRWNESATVRLEDGATLTAEKHFRGGPVIRIVRIVDISPSGEIRADEAAGTELTLSEALLRHADRHKLATLHTPVTNGGNAVVNVEDGGVLVAFVDEQ